MHAASARRLTAPVVGLVLIAAACSMQDTTTEVDDASQSTTSITASADESTATELAATDALETDPAALPAADSPSDPGDDGVRRVPEEYESIQLAVDAELELDNGIRVLGATGVAVENLTAMNYTKSGVFWISAQGYRASYITTYRTGDYGIYAFDSIGGQIEHSHTVGSRDAGVYVGQCHPCDTVVTDVVSSYNGFGYSGTNSGGNLLIVNSAWHDNRVGIAPNSGSYELCSPQRGTTIVGNLVFDNNQPDTPAVKGALVDQGNGILVVGGIRNVIERNRVDGHVRTGIGLVPYRERAPNDDQPSRDEWDLRCEQQKLLEVEMPDIPIVWDAIQNRVADNVVSGSGEADLAVASLGTDLDTLGNCFGGNEFATSAPAELEALAPCEGEGSGGDWTAGGLDVNRWNVEQDSLPPEAPWQQAPLPKLDVHDTMPDAATAPAHPATDVPYPVDLDAIQIPDLAAS